MLLALGSKMSISSNTKLNHDKNLKNEDKYSWKSATYEIHNISCGKALDDPGRLG